MRLIYAVILGFVGFVTSFGAHIVAVNLPVYAKQVGVGVAMIGLLIAVYDLAEIVAKPVFGAIADRAGMKKTMLLGIVVFIASSLAYLWARPQLLLLIRFLQGVGAAALSAVSLALVGIYYKETRGRAYGIYNTIKGAGYVLSPLVGGALVVRKNFGYLFIASAAVGIVAFLMSLFVPDVKEKTRPFEEEDELSLKAVVTVLRAPILWRWYLIIVVNMFFVSILFGFVPVYLSSLGYKPEVAGVLLSVLALSYLLVQPLAGWLADKYEARATVLWGITASALAVLLIPFSKGVPLVVISVVAGLGIGTVWTNSDAAVSSLAKEGRLGATMGTAGSFKEFGDMVGPILIGVLSQAFGLTVGFTACGVLGLMSLALMVFRRG
jgi:MFS transporter, ACDE family, multidrug resistance protein